MKILNVISSLNPAHGGTVAALQQFRVALERRLHPVETVCIDEAKDPWLVATGGCVHAVGPGVMNYRYCKRLKDWLRANVHRYDAVLVHGLWQYHSVAVRNAMRRSSIPYFVFPHGMLDPWFKQAYPLKHLKKRLYWPWGDYRVLRDARAVFFTCDEERRLARESFSSYECKERIVSLGISPPVGNAAQQRELFFERFPELRGKRIILFLGRIHEKKGCDLLVLAFAELAAREPDAHLVLAGPQAEPVTNRLKSFLDARGLASRATWPGMLSGDLKYGAFHAAEVFALISHQENFGVSVVEALSCGLPVLLSNKVNIWREIKDDGAGLAASDDDQGASELLHGWFDHSDVERAAFRSRALACFKQRYEIGSATDNLVATLRAEGVAG